MVANFVFRLRVRMKTSIKLDGLPTTLTVPGFPPIELKIEPRAGAEQPRVDGERFTFIGRNYDNEPNARDAGKRLSDALIVSGALGSLGIDVGFSRATGSFGKQVHDAVREETGKELRHDLFGLMTYENDRVRIVGIEATGATATTPKTLQDHLVRWRAANLTERQRICAALLNDTFYIAQAEAQFVLAVSAVEALCDQADLSAEYLQVVDGLLNHLAGMDADETARATLQANLMDARRKSITQAFMGKLRTLLHEDDARLFKKLYRLRSKFVHEGLGRGELQEAANSARDIARKLLEAELAPRVAPRERDVGHDDRG